MDGVSLRIVIAVLLLHATSSAAAAQSHFAVEASWGAARNVASATAETDGWLNLTVDWIHPSGVGLGLGTDHYFEDTAISGAGHEGWSVYVSPSYELARRVVSPFVRGGIGAGPAPCKGDTCGDGVHLRGSAGVRIRFAGSLRVSVEVGISRVSRPFGGAGLSFRL